jgi:hypothetical protein
MGILRRVGILSLVGIANVVENLSIAVGAPRATATGSTAIVANFEIARDHRREPTFD